MLRRIGTTLRTQWMGALALFVALTTGTAYAANTVFSADIVDGEVKAVDLANGAVTNVKLADGAIGKSKISAGAVENGKIAEGAVGQSKLANGAATNAKIADGAVNSQKLQNDTVAGIDVNEAALDGGSIPGTTARAYGRVAANGILTNSKNVVSETATSPAGGTPTGTYCIGLADSIDASTAIVVPETDYIGDSTDLAEERLAWAKARGGTTCSIDNAIAVITGVLDINEPGTVMNSSNQAFTFVVP